MSDQAVNGESMQEGNKGRRYCGAKLKDGGGETCNNSAGLRTPHPGYGKCWKHGGTSHNLILAAAKEQLADMAASFATDIDIDPKEVLLSSIGRSWGTVYWCQDRITAIEDEVRQLNEPGQLTEDQVAKRRHELTKLMLVMNKLYGSWIDRAAMLAKLALDLGIQQQVIDIRKQQASGWLLLIRQMLDDPAFGLSDEQKVAGLNVLDKRMGELLSAQ